MFKTVIKLKPDYYRAYLALGICYDKLNNTVGAKRFYKKYLNMNKLAPNYYDITQRIANLSFKMIISTLQHQSLKIGQVMIQQYTLLILVNILLL